MCRDRKRDGGVSPSRYRVALIPSPGSARTLGRDGSLGAGDDLVVSRASERADFTAKEVKEMRFFEHARIAKYEQRVRMLQLEALRVEFERAERHLRLRRTALDSLVRLAEVVRSGQVSREDALRCLKETLAETRSDPTKVILDIAMIL